MRSGVTVAIGLAATVGWFALVSCVPATTPDAAEIAPPAGPPDAGAVAPEPPAPSPEPNEARPSPALDCGACHAEPTKGRAAAVDADHRGAHWRASGAATEPECAICHDSSGHLQGKVRLWALPGRPSAAFEVTGDPQQLVAFCVQCHGDGGQPLVHATHSSWQPACTECHAVHDPSSTNLARIRKTVRNSKQGADVSVTFSARTGPGSFSDGVGAGDGLCQVCHTATKYHRADGTGSPHHEGADCAGCHLHSAGFSPLNESTCIRCHSQPQGRRAAVVHGDGTGGHHLSAPALADEDCVQCHEMSRHREGAVQLWTDPVTKAGSFAVSSDPNQLLPFCAKCHDSTKHASVHATGTNWVPACTECHSLHDPASQNRALVARVVWQRNTGAALPVVFTAETGAGSFSDGVGANDGICQVCHTGTKYHRSDGSGPNHHAATDCTVCHLHPAGFLPTGATACIGCHSESMGTRGKVVNADGSGGHQLVAPQLTDADCAQCHETTQHRQGVVRLWQDPNAKTSAIGLSGDPNQLVPFCAACHAGLTAPVVHATGASWQPACTECHQVHNPSGTNVSLVADVVQNRTLGAGFPVVFTARTGAGSFSDGVGANDGICQVCHTATGYHRHDGSGTPHREAQDCARCHGHATGFIPAGGASCLGCHATVQGPRRAVVGEFGLPSHHVRGGAVTDADCRVCHDMSQHQLGQVRLCDVDDPNNPVAVVALTGNPMTTFSEATKLEPFCLACHDPNAAGGTAPFSSGAWPVAINATAWSASSHRAEQTTCIGDGETFGCHSTGHGSAKVRLLAPADASQPPVPGDPLRQEEGFCYACHDAGGPGSDTQTQFALASHHKVNGLEQANGAKVECANCHNPHLARPDARLIDPESGTTWTGTGEAFCLKCHDGTAPLGVSFPVTSPGTGYDKSAFAGTTHSTGLASTGCTHCHAWHGSADASLLRAAYAVADHTPYSASAYAVCWQCHAESQVLTQANAFDVNHEAHVDGNQAPCIMCHDVHRGFDAGEPGLIDLDYPVRKGGYDIQFIGGKDGSTAFYLNGQQTLGSCYISCHSMDHTPLSYPRSPLFTATCAACH